ncbi:MAG: hypothetical protein IT236_10575 [Bacteroidia bacterium]|nr:hypothetical protein [Bacteroidia bacterium]
MIELVALNVYRDLKSLKKHKSSNFKAIGLAIFSTNSLSTKQAPKKIGDEQSYS